MPATSTVSAAQPNRGADDDGIAAEMRSPGRVAEHDALRAPLVVAIEAAAEPGLRAEHTEVVARHAQDAEALGASVGRPDRAPVSR